MGKRKPVHRSIKERLGYEPDIPDKEFLADWKRRSTHVCKPCWELKYCPYGPFVEQSPLLPQIREDVLAHNNYLKECLAKGAIGNKGPLPEHERLRYESTVFMFKRDPLAIFKILGGYLAKAAEIDKALSDGKTLREILGGDMPPIHQGRAPFPFEEKDTKESDIPEEIKKMVKLEIVRMKKVLKSGILDTRTPLNSGRRADFERNIQDSDPENFPEEIPEAISDLSCNIFGHICPIVFVGENISETSDHRRRGRYLSFHTKMRVVRRDNHTCQKCSKHLRDDEVEFDHIIPFSKGGSSEEQNIRLTCFDCNRSKSDKTEI